MQTCKKCGGHCKPAKAYKNKLVESLDFRDSRFGDRGNTLSRRGRAELVYCMKCTKCGHSFIPDNLQDKAFEKIKKFYFSSATIRSQPGWIKINAYVLVDKDLEFFKELEGMYKNIMIKRSGTGLVVILNF